MKSKQPTNLEYQAFLTDVRRTIDEEWYRAARSVNAGLISLYWQLGQRIAETQKVKAWGDQVIHRLARDLQAEYPGRRGFTDRNLRNVRLFWRTYSDPEFRKRAVSELDTPQGKPQGPLVRTGVGAPDRDALLHLLFCVPWGHHILILQKARSPAEHVFYLRATAQYGWTRNLLHHALATHTFESSQAEGKTHNFPVALPEDLAEQAEEALRSSYSVDFLGLRGKYKERELESRMVERVRHFMLQLGYGFCFIDRQYRLMVGESEFFIDLLFYHRFLKALVAIELKAGPFKPEHAGKMDFYLNVLNDHVRAPDDNPSIGIILCTGKDDLVVEYSLKSKGNPIGVAHYEVTSKLPKELKGRLPSAEELRRALTPADDERLNRYV